MSRLTSICNDLCKVRLPCSHRKANLCTFRVWEEAVIETLAKGDPENRACYLGMAGVLVEPCLDLDAEERQRGVANVLGLCTPGNNFNGEVRNI